MALLGLPSALEPLCGPLNLFLENSHKLDQVINTDYSFILLINLLINRVTEWLGCKCFTNFVLDTFFLQTVVMGNFLILLVQTNICRISKLFYSSFEIVVPDMHLAFQTSCFGTNRSGSLFFANYCTEPFFFWCKICIVSFWGIYFENCGLWQLGAIYGGIRFWHIL